MAALVAASATACGVASSDRLTGSGTIVVEHAWARATPKGAPTGAAYVTLINNGAQTDRLISAASPVAQSAMFHEDHLQNGISTMRMLDAVDLPPGKTVALEPNGMHIMLIINSQLQQGQTFPLTLTFEKAGAIQVTVSVGSVGAMTDPGPK